MTDIDLDALEATARAATPGPWIIDSIESGEHGIFLPDGHPECGEMGCGGDQVAGFMVGKNALHIAAFDPTTTLALTARLREAEVCIDAALDYAPDPTETGVEAVTEPHPRVSHATV